ncbi:MAG: hypothetical protein ACLFV6_03475 [Spirulinaceae cyanobacterium]
MFDRILDKIGDWNPQLFREVKGRLKSRNIAIAGGISAIVQGITYLFFLTRYPGEKENFNRYCQSRVPTNWDGYNPHNFSDSQFCARDAAGYLQPGVFNSELWWLDIFTTLSFVAIFALLVVGVYMLISDLSREERRGTLGFIRLSPQSTRSLLIGKILGVPALLYLAVAMTLPLHIGSAIAAHLDIGRVFGFYLVLAVSGAFYFSGSLLYGLVSASLGNFQAWVGAGAILSFLWFGSFYLLDTYSNMLTFSLADLFLLLHPAAFLPYVVSTAPHSLDTISYLHVKDFAELTWFELPFFHKANTAIAFILANFGVGTYWIWQGLQRRFHNPNTTIINKRQSYFLSGSIVLAMMGFAVQQGDWRDSSTYLLRNFNLLYVFLMLMSLGLIACLSPHRQTLQDWARYRHQNNRNARSLWRDLVWGEQSPATLAVALNFVVTGSMILVAIFMLPFREYRVTALLGLVCTISIVLVYATIAQWMLMMKSHKRGVWAATTIMAAILMPLLGFAILTIDPTNSLYRGLWLFSATPSFATKMIAFSTVGWALLGEWTAIVLMNVQMSRQLKKAGESATQALLQGRDRAAMLS